MINNHVSHYIIRFRNHLIRAEDESEIKSLRQKRSYKYRKARGEYIGKAPYGYKTIKSKDKKRVLVENVQEQSIIKNINNKYNKGYTMNNIAYELNNKNLLRRGKEWTTSKICYILNRDNKSFKTFNKNILEDDKKTDCDNDELAKKRKYEKQKKERNERFKKRSKKYKKNKRKKNIII